MEYLSVTWNRFIWELNTQKTPPKTWQFPKKWAQKQPLTAIISQDIVFSWNLPPDFQADFQKVTALTGFWPKFENSFAKVFFICLVIQKNGTRNIYAKKPFSSPPYYYTKIDILRLLVYISTIILYGCLLQRIVNIQEMNNSKKKMKS